MWCRQCSQDVPAVAAGEADDAIVCARCSTPLRDSATEQPQQQSSSGGREADSIRRIDPPQLSTGDVHAPVGAAATRRPIWAASLWGLDDLALAADLDRADKLLQQHGQAVAPVVSGATTYSGPAEGLREQGLATSPVVASPAPQPIEAAPTVQLSWLVWSLVCGGMMALVFGMVLCGWSLGTAREDLWRIGLPSLLGGQAALLLGFVFQLDSLWRNYQATNQSLERLHRRLARISQPQSDSQMP